jgi:hypothetical protein
MSPEQIVGLADRNIQWYLTNESINTVGKIKKEAQSVVNATI